MITKDKGLIYSEYVINFLGHSDLAQKFNILVDTFYNCREQGYVLLVFDKEYNKKVYIWIYAHRNSDRPTIVYGMETNGRNMFDDEQWRKQRSFEYIDDAVNYVEEIIKENILTDNEKEV